MNSPVELIPQEHYLSAETKTWLAHVVHRHKDVGDVFVRFSGEGPVTSLELDKRVIKLVQRFRFQTAQSLAEIEVLLLEALQFRTMTEERLLRFEQQLLNFNNFSVRNGGIPNAND